MVFDYWSNTLFWTLIEKDFANDPGKQRLTRLLDDEFFNFRLHGEKYFVIPAFCERIINGYEIPEGEVKAFLEEIGLGEEYEKWRSS